MIPAGGKRPYWMCRVDRWVGGQGAGAGAGSGRRGGERARAQVCAGILGVACMARALATCEPRGDLLTWKLLKDITGSSAEAAASDCTTVSGFFAMRACGGERWRQRVIQRRDARRFQRQRAARRPHESQRDDGSERALPFAP